MSISQRFISYLISKPLNIFKNLFKMKSTWKRVHTFYKYFMKKQTERQMGHLKPKQRLTLVYKRPRIYPYMISIHQRCTPKLFSVINGSIHQALMDSMLNRKKAWSNIQFTRQKALKKVIRIRKGKLKNKKVKTDRFDCYFYNGWKYKRLRMHSPWQLGGWCSSYVRSTRIPRFLFKRKKRGKKLAKVRKQRYRMDALRAQRRQESTTSSIDDAKKGTHRFLLMTHRAATHAKGEHSSSAAVKSFSQKKFSTRKKRNNKFKSRPVLIGN